MASSLPAASEVPSASSFSAKSLFELASFTSRLSRKSCSRSEGASFSRFASAECASARRAAAQASSSAASSALSSKSGFFRKEAARASSSASTSSDTAFRFLATLSAVGQPAFAQPTRSAGLAESHQMGPPSRPASVDEHDMQPVVTAGLWGPGFRRCNGTLQIDVVPKFVDFLSIACSEHKNSNPGFFHLAMSAASPHFSFRQ
mmetsp:Transcript_62433/g.165678  ORF Transcript_62433/g.165678 Transcript_62433/m.165678 type:complete len:204 (-) Transcript_62433:272-883(-)